MVSVALVGGARLPTAVATAAPAATFYVSPSGTPGGDGSAQRPWDLQTALSQPSSVGPGSTIRVAGGVYSGNFTSTLEGTSNAPIVVRGTPGERATIDGGMSRANILTVRGANAWYRDFEVMSSSPMRVTSTDGSHPEDLTRGEAVEVLGPHTRFINLVVHDAAQGFGFWRTAVDSEIYGSLIYHNGWDGPGRGHGHGIYAQNAEGTKRVVDNIVFSQFGSGIHAYGSPATALNDLRFEGNVVFTNGSLSTKGYSRNFLVGGEDGLVARRPALVANATYTPPSSGKGQVNLGYHGGCTDAVVTGNYLVERDALTLVNCSGATINANTFHGATSGFAPASFPNNTYLSEPRSGVVTRVRPNAYEVGRANITVFNWDQAPSAQVDVSGVGLGPGDGYEVRDAQNFYGEPVAGGVFGGGAITVPMDSTQVAPPVGQVPVPATHTPREFGAFVIVKAAAPVVPPVQLGPPFLVTR